LPKSQESPVLHITRQPILFAQQADFLYLPHLKQVIQFDDEGLQAVLALSPTGCCGCLAGKSPIVPAHAKSTTSDQPPAQSRLNSLGAQTTNFTVQ
jgi:hypothetical protein